MSLGWMGGWSPRLAAAWRASSQNCSRVGQYPPWEKARGAPRQGADPVRSAALSFGGRALHRRIGGYATGSSTWRRRRRAAMSSPSILQSTSRACDERLAATLEGRRIRFAPVGLGGASTAYAGQYGSHGLRRVAQLDALLDEFVGPNRDIDVLKVDCRRCEWDVLQHLVEHAARVQRVTSIVQFELHFFRLGGLGLRNASRWRRCSSSTSSSTTAFDRTPPSVSTAPVAAGPSAARRSSLLRAWTRLAPTMDTHACCYNVRFVRHARGRNCRATEHATAARRSAARHEHLGIGAGALPPLPIAAARLAPLDAHRLRRRARRRQRASDGRGAERADLPRVDQLLPRRGAVRAARAGDARPAHVRALHVRGFKPHFGSTCSRQTRRRRTTCSSSPTPTCASRRSSGGRRRRSNELGRTAANAVTTLVAGASAATGAAGRGTVSLLRRQRRMRRRPRAHVRRAARGIRGVQRAAAALPRRAAHH